MNFCWTCPQYVWKTCGRLLWTGPCPLPAALPGFLGLPQWETGERNGKAGHLHVTRQNSAGEATCGLPSSHLHGPTSR